ncbi:MAG TPA: 2OG-Fe(II) oxygenase [Alphaproteobacteria bacterium]|nr:2OG-Fe(II) oxygenase [Alphaproteobacteria bacterium]
MPVFDLAALEATPLHRDPFDYIIVPHFVRGEAMAALERDYPRIAKPGSFPVGELDFGPAFRAMLDEFASPEMRTAFARKFAVDLEGRPLMTTVRGRCQQKDGRIHTDTKSKIITVLIYLNSKWENPGGRLRLLRSQDDVEDFAAEVPPDEGTLLAFRRSDTSFHGHKPFVGERRVIQFNWVTSARVVWRERLRHRLSAWIKGLDGYA